MSSSTPNGGAITFAHVYKGLLIEFCRKDSLPDPVYTVKKEGPDHVPSFTATVKVNGVEYSSHACGRRVDAEQMAAHEALKGAYSSAGIPLNICALVYEAGLCKAMLQEYASQKGFGLPNYVFREHKSTESRACFICTITVGSTVYEGPCGQNKKAAEKNTSMFALTSIMNASNPAAAAANVVEVPVLHEKKPSVK